MVDVATGAGGKSNEQVFYNLNVPVFISKSLLNFSIIILYVMLIVVFYFPVSSKNSVLQSYLEVYLFVE